MCQQKEKDMTSIYSIGQMNWLANRLEEEGFSAEDVTELGQYKDLPGIRGLFTGAYALKRVKHIIDCDADPFCPGGWKVEEHQKGGRLEWSPDGVKLYLSEVQKESSQEGNKLRKELTGKPVLNVNTLDYLLKYPELIPEEWEGKAIFFWGTIYRDSGGGLIVRYLSWSGSVWNCGYDWLDSDFDDDYPALLRAS
jgi:hypothetical protein